MDYSVQYKQSVSQGRHRAILNEREHLVVPAILAKEIVMNDVLYSAEELSKVVSIWNGVPVPVNHPRNTGIEATASTPKDEETRNIGRIYNTRFEDKKLKGEMWIDIAKTKKLGFENLLKRLENNETVNVSIGVLGDIKKEKGNFDGKPYTQIISNLRADHVAILPDSDGACSIEDGCGTNLLNQTCDCEDKDSCDCFSQTHNQKDILMNENDKKKSEAKKDEKIEAKDNKESSEVKANEEEKGKTKTKTEAKTEAKSNESEMKADDNATVTIPVKEYVELQSLANKKDFLTQLEKEFNERMDGMKKVVSKAYPALKDQLDNLNADALKALHNQATASTTNEGRVGNGSVAKLDSKDAEGLVPAGLFNSKQYRETLNGKKGN